MSLITKKLVVSILAITLLSASYAQESDKKKSDNFKINGSINVGTFFYNSDGPGNRQQPFGYSLGGQVNISLYGIMFPFYGSLNEQGSSFNHPFNRYGVSPRYKWVRAHLGYRSMEMSEFTLASTTFFGAGLELTPGKFRFSAMYGNMKQPAGLENLNYITPQFNRKALAFKIGKGTEKNYFDFIVFRAKDDTTSLTLPDSISKATPAHENLVLGIKNKNTMFKGKVVFDLDASLSAFTNDIRYNPMELSGDGSLDWTKAVFTPNLTTSVNYAGESNIRYQSKIFSLGFKYRRIMPDFKTLGSEYILSDLEAITINPSFQLFNGMVTFSGSVGNQRNNLDGARISTNNRMISSINISANPSPYYGIMAGYSNYTFQQQVILDTLYNDSLVVNQLNHNIMFVPRYMFVSDKLSNTILLTINYQILNDLNDVSIYSASNTMLVGNLSYSAMVKKSGIALNFSINYFKFSTSMVEIDRVGVVLGANVPLLKKKLMLTTNLNYNTQNETNGKSSIIIANVSARYKIFMKTNVGLQAYLNFIDGSSQNYTENRLQLSVSQGF